MPDQTIRQALFIDSKAEKTNRTATIQMSQTSLWVRQHRAGSDISEKGFLPAISEYEDKETLIKSEFPATQGCVAKICDASH